MAKAKKVAYNEDAIEALEGLEGVRENVDMYLGHQESQVMHCLREVVENTIDIWSKGLNSFCHIIVSGSKKEQVFTVIDEGPGIPVGVHKKLGISTLEVVLTKLHAGSNFKAQEKDKTATRGKHGVGVSCVCAVSKEFYASTFRDGKWYSQTFSKGRKKTEVERVKNPVTPICAIPKVKSGTVIQYALDKSVMPDTVLTKNQIFDYGRIVSALCKGLKVRVTFNGEEKTFHNKHGIIDALDFFKERNSKKNTDYLGKPFQFEADSIQCAIQWSNLPGEDNVANYVNFASTPDVQSTSVKGAFDVIGRVFKKVKVKGADFTAADLREGMVLVLHYMCNNARYAGQNKEKLNTVEAVEDVKRLLEQPLTKWVKENEKLVRKIIKRASDIRKARAEAKKITQAASSLKASKKNLAGSDKLRMCSKKCPAAERELILAEGDSAGGALFLARNNYNQVILSLRGKPLNVMKTKSIAQDLKNKEIQDILIAIGADPKKIAKGEHLTEVAVGKILLATDADIDGPLEANTKVWMLDGTKPTIKELAQRWEKNPEPFWVLSRNNKGELVPAQAIAPRITTTTDEYIKVTFDNGLVKRVTGNHKWVVNKAKKSEFVSEENGNNYIRTKHLSVGDSINSFYAISSAADGSPRKEGEYITILNEHSRFSDRRKMPLHQLVQSWKDRKLFKKYRKSNFKSGASLGETRKGCIHIHHLDGDKGNNTPQNLGYLLQSEHGREHRVERCKTYNGSKKHLKDLACFFTSKKGKKVLKENRQRLIDYNKSGEHRKTTSWNNANREDILYLQILGKVCRLLRGFKKSNYKLNKENWHQALRTYNACGWEMLKTIPKEDLRKSYLDTKGKYYPITEKVMTKSKNTYPGQAITKFLNVCQKVYAEYGYIDEETYTNSRIRMIRKGKIPQGTPTWEYMIKRKVSPEKDFQKWVDSCLEKTNHKVVKLEKVVSKKERNFYCLTVPEHGNFFIDDGDGNGICSGNCHIRTLINCILYKYVRAVFSANMVYILKMPLYQAAWTEKGEEVRSYGDTLEEAMKGAPKRAIVTRFKGLGEMTAEQMQPYAHSDSKLRKLVPITEIEAKKDHDEYMRLTGENTDYRKKMFNIQ